MSKSEACVLAQHIGACALGRCCCGHLLTRVACSPQGVPTADRTWHPLPLPCSDLERLL